MVPSLQRVLGSKNTSGSSSRDFCLYITLKKGNTTEDFKKIAGIFFNADGVDEFSVYCAVSLIDVVVHLWSLWWPCNGAVLRTYV